MIRASVWDFTHLYAAIYNSLVRMEPYIIGKKSNTLRSKHEIKQFKTAKELSRRIALGEYNFSNYDYFTRSIRGLGASHFEVQVVQLKDRWYTINDLQEKHFIQLLHSIMERHSRRWWD